MQTRSRRAQPECGVCFERITIRGKLDYCDHVFCAPCIARWAEVRLADPEGEPVSAVQIKVRGYLAGAGQAAVQRASTKASVSDG